MTALIWTISFVFDILLTLYYFRGRELQMATRSRRILGFTVLLTTYILYPSGILPLLSNSFVRFIIRTVLTGTYLFLARKISVKTAAYASAYWGTMHLLTHNIFFVPAMFPILNGAFPFTGHHTIDLVLCTIVISLATATSCFLFDRFTPLVDMGPIDLSRLLFLTLIVTVGIYTKELALPLRTLGVSAPTALSMCYVMLMISLLLLLLFIEYYRRQHISKAAAELQTQAAEALLRSIEAQRENSENIRRLRHDLKNHMLTVRLLLREEGVEKTDAYIGQFLDEAAVNTQQFHTGHHLMDGILMYKLASVSDRQIETQVNLDFATGSFISNFDMCVIMGNILDNALEACDRIPEGKRRRIVLTGGVSAGCLILRLKNSCTDMPLLINGLPYTIKGNAYAHGFGLRNVERALKHYNGELSISMDEAQLFTLTILIPLPTADPLIQ